MSPRRSRRSAANGSAFTRALAERRPDPGARGERRWVYVGYDQLSADIGPLSSEDPRELGIVLLENPEKAARRPYHQQKLFAVLANGRQFALEQAARGVAVRHQVVAPGSTYAGTLIDLASQLGPLRVLEPAEREHRHDLAPAIAKGALRVVPHDGWISERSQFERSQGQAPPYRMDAFYRSMRQATGLLMDGDAPLGGRYSFDSENRLPYRGSPPAPAQLRFATDAVDDEVAELITRHFGTHPGTLDPGAMPTTQADAEAMWRWAKQHALPHFGPYEDAMSSSARRLFHTSVSVLVNLSRLLPRRLVTEVAEAAKLPLPTREGFVRQILGWREFMHHVHVATDGLRDLAEWRARLPAPPPEVPLLPAYWGKPSGLRCLDDVVAAVWEEGYSHHITRLMVLSNLAMLVEASPRELTDWFWIAYVDAYDWVVEPNVLAMGTFSLGDVLTTKPYVAGAAYIHKMSDFCGSCAFDPKKTCPVTPLYWAYLARHQEQLAANHRMKLPLAAAAKRSPSLRRADAAVFAKVQTLLGEGKRLAPGTDAHDVIDADAPFTLSVT
jgi:deoxyribodipyrimidine photolyase-related protein